MKHLLRDAAEGLPVAQRKVTWDSERPTVKAVGDATKLRGFVEYGRQPLPYRPVEDRLQDYGEVLGRLPQQDQEELLHTQAARCMDCGTPFCHQTSSGMQMWYVVFLRLQSSALRHTHMLCSAWTAAITAAIRGYRILSFIERPQLSNFLAYVDCKH